MAKVYDSLSERQKLYYDNAPADLLLRRIPEDAVAFGLFDEVSQGMWCDDCHVAGRAKLVDSGLSYLMSSVSLRSSTTLDSFPSSSTHIARS